MGKLISYTSNNQSIQMLLFTLSKELRKLGKAQCTSILQQHIRSKNTPNPKLFTVQKLRQTNAIEKLPNILANFFSSRLKKKKMCQNCDFTFFSMSESFSSFQSLQRLPQMSAFWYEFLPTLGCLLSDFFLFFFSFPFTSRCILVFLFLFLDVCSNSVTVAWSVLCRNTQRNLYLAVPAGSWVKMCYLALQLIWHNMPGSILDISNNELFLLKWHVKTSVLSLAISCDIFLVILKII